MEAYGQQNVSESYLELKRRFGDFLNEHRLDGEERYVDRLEPLFDDNKDQSRNLRLLVDVHDLQRFDEGVHKTLLTTPCECMRPFEDALRETAKGLQDGQFGIKQASRIEVRRLCSCPASDPSGLRRCDACWQDLA